MLKVPVSTLFGGHEGTSVVLFFLHPFQMYIFNLLGGHVFH